MHFFVWLLLIISPFIPLKAFAGCGEFLQNRIEHTRKALELAKNGENRKSEVVGFHGTSVESLAMALITGSFPGDNADHPNEFFIVPVNKRIPKSKRSKFNGDWETSEDAIEEASDYAEQNAFTHAILNGLNPTRRVGKFTEDVRELGRSSTSEEDLLIFAQHYQSAVRDREHIRTILVSARQRKGIVLGVAANAYTSIPWKIPATAKDYIQFKTNGFPLSGIRTILPLSEGDAQAIEQLLASQHP